MEVSTAQNGRTSDIYIGDFAPIVTAPEVFSLDATCQQSDLTSRETELIAAAAAASGASASDITVNYGSGSESYAVNWNFDTTDESIRTSVSSTAFTNELKAELLSETAFQACFRLTTCEDRPEELDGLIDGVVVQGVSCSVIGSIYVDTFGGDACTDATFLENCPVTCGQCACSAADCNNQGTTSDNNYADGCLCDCDTGFTGDNCENAFSLAPSRTPSSQPSFAIPSVSPSLAPSCYEYNSNQLGNPDLRISEEDSTFDGTNFILALRVPNIYEVDSLSFVGSDLAKYEGPSNPGSWSESPIDCLRVWSTNMDFNTFLDITTFSATDNKYCSKLSVDLYENDAANRDIKYEMPWCVSLATETQVAASIDVNIDEPGFLQVSRSAAMMHPDYANDEAQVVLEFTTQVVFPWTIDGTYSWLDETNVISNTATLTETNTECNSRDYCWQDWRLEFRVDSVCLRLFNLNFQMTAAYNGERQNVQILGEILPEASCAVTIDDINTQLSGAILLSPDVSDFSDATQLYRHLSYRYHVQETVYAQVTISDNPAPITNLAVDTFTLTQNGNTFDQSFTEVTQSGGQIVMSFVLDPPVAGTIAGITTTLSVALTITYGDGTVRRRRLQSDVSSDGYLDRAGVSIVFIIQNAGCSAPQGNAGDIFRSQCQVAGSEEIRHCDRGQWHLLGQSCPEPPLLEGTQEDAYATSSSKDYTWEIVFLSVLCFAIAVVGYVIYSYCLPKSDQWTIPGPKLKETPVMA